jgi:hypothetical protein
MEFIIMLVLIGIFFLVRLISKIIRIIYLLSSEYYNLSIQDQRSRIALKLNLRKFGIWLK